VSLRRAPTGRWEVRWREGGRRYGRTFDVRADAVAFRLEIRRRQQLGGFVTPELDVTLAEFVGEWWELHVVPNLAPHTQVGYARLLTKHLLPELGGTRFRGPNTARSQPLARGEASTRSGRADRPQVARGASVVLRLAVEEERVDANSVDKIRKPSQLPRRSVDPIPPLMIERLRGELALRDATLVSVLAYAGLRPGEALGLRWRDIGQRRLAIDRAVAFGEIKSTKTGRTRSVNLLEPLADDLETWRAVVIWSPQPGWSSRAQTLPHGRRTTGRTGAIGSIARRPDASDCPGPGPTTSGRPSCRCSSSRGRQ